VHETQRGGYSPRAVYESNERLREVFDLLANGFFSQEDQNLFRPLTDSLLDHDAYLLFADFDAYVECQRKVSDAFLDRTTWHSMTVKNIAKMGMFSSDRTIREYATEIWGAEQVKIRLRPYHDPTA
jgi:starch phosphorylase